MPAAPGSTGRACKAAEQFIPSAYVDYGRRLTAEGGIAITYKDVDLRFRVFLWRVLFWVLATSGEGWLIFHHAPFANPLMSAGCLFVVATINWVIVRQPPKVVRTIEIRPECMILEGRDVFWLRYMDTGWPSFRPGKDKDSLVLTGIYGTRQVEFLTARRFDECDRSPEVLSAHLQDAMKQLWTQPY